MFSFVRTLSQRRARQSLARRARLAFERLEPLSMLSAMILGTAYDDLAGNGARDLGDPGLEGVTVYLDQNANGQLDTGESSTVTDGAGGYVFADLTPGNYQVSQLLASGTLQIAPAPATGVGINGDFVGTVIPSLSTSNLKGLAWANGDLYGVDSNTGNNNVYRIDPATGQMTFAFTTPGEVIGLTFDGVNFWGLDSANKTIFHMSGVDGSQIGSAINTPNGKYIGAIAWHDGFLWAAESDFGSVIYKLASNGQVISSIPLPSTHAGGLTSDGHSLWVNSFATPRTFELDPATGTVRGSFATPEFLMGITFDGHYLRAIDRRSPLIVQIDRGRPESIPVTLADGQIAAGIDFGNFHMPSHAGQAYEDIDGDATRDVEELGMAGWWVYVDTNGNNSFEQAYENQAITDASGNYSLSLRPGASTLREVLRTPGWQQNAPSGAAYVVTPVSGQEIGGPDFANQQVGLGPVGAESLVNQTDLQVIPDANVSLGNTVASDSAGNFVVVWVGGSNEIFARLFNASGSPLSGEFRVDQTVAGNGSATVARAANGSFVVGWTSNGSVRARRFNAAGTPQGGEFVVYSKRNTSGWIPSIAMDATGNFAVAYHATAPSSPSKLYIHRYSASGATQGKPINLGEVQGQTDSRLSMDANGNFAVTWTTGGMDVLAQRYNSAGSPVGGTISVAVSTTNNDWAPAISMTSSGDFVVVWERISGARGTWAQIYNSNGTPRGSSFLVSSDANSRHKVAMDNSGIVVARDVWYNSFTNFDVRFSRFDVNGVAIGGDYVVNSTIPGIQRTPSVVMQGGGRFVIDYVGSGLGDAEGVFFQRYAPPPAPLVAASLPAISSQQTLTAMDVQPILAEAFLRWQASGVSTAALAGINVQVADLPGALLGQAAGNTIWLDRNAAGWGWFVDTTPRDDREFVLPGNQGEQNRMDLLTVVMHELGHLQGHDHDADGVMAETLAAGVRRTGLEHDDGARVDLVMGHASDHRELAWLGAWLHEQFDSAHGRARRRR